MKPGTERIGQIYRCVDETTIWERPNKQLKIESLGRLNYGDLCQLVAIEDNQFDFDEGVIWYQVFSKEFLGWAAFWKENEKSKQTIRYTKNTIQ